MFCCLFRCRDRGIGRVEESEVRDIEGESFCEMLVLCLGCCLLSEFQVFLRHCLRLSLLGRSFALECAC